MKGRYDLSIEAQKDLIEIADYLKTEAGNEIADKVLDQLQLAFQNLSENPGIGHFRNDLLDPRHKFWNVYSYMIVYRWKTAPIQILAIVHGARDLSPYFTRRGIV